MQKVLCPRSMTSREFTISGGSGEKKVSVRLRLPGRRMLKLELTVNDTVGDVRREAVPAMQLPAEQIRLSRGGITLGYENDDDPIGSYETKLSTITFVAEELNLTLR
ncbi:MAG: hypothetical protein MHM6MM_008186, partial [Cercozoa sp. M6MM]